MSYSPKIEITNVRYKPQRDMSGALVHGTIVTYLMDGAPCSAHFNDQLTPQGAARALRDYDRYRRPPKKEN